MALNVTEQVSATLQRSRTVLVTFPVHYALDALAAATALALALRQTGKVVDVVCDGFTPQPLHHFLPPADIRPHIPALQQLLITVGLGGVAVEQFSYDIQGDRLTVFLTPKAGMILPSAVSAKASDFRYDLIVTVNAADLPSLGGIYANQREFFSRTTVINFDYQPANEHYGQINAVDLTAAAASEVVYDLLPTLPIPLPPSRQLATALLAGIIDATKSFRSHRVTAKTLRIASALVEAGANREGIVRTLFQSHDLTTLKLWGRTLARLHASPDSRLVWAAVTQDDFLEAEATLDDLPGLTDQLLGYLPRTEVVILLAQESSTVTIRLTSLRNLHALHLSRPFPAQGDRRVATWRFENRGLADAEREVIAAVRQNLRELSGESPTEVQSSSV